jgi:hypothetical protein
VMGFVLFAREGIVGLAKKLWERVYGRSRT